MRTVLTLFLFIFLLPHAALAEIPETVSMNKAWNVTFNVPMAYDDPYQSIYVVDSSGKKASIYIGQSEDQKTFQVTPAYADTYKPGETYTLHVTEGLTSTAGVPFNKATQKTFQIYQKNDLAISLQGIELGETVKTEVERRYGQAIKQEVNANGYTWASYHNHYNHFILLAYDPNGRVQGFYTNQTIIDFGSDLQIGSAYADVTAVYGEGTSGTDQKSTSSIVQWDGKEYRLFFDKHDQYKLTAIMALTEEGKTHTSTTPYDRMTTVALYEMQVFEIMNARRVRAGLVPYVYDAEAREAARAHSEDMAERGFFDHVNPDGEGFMDRLEEANVTNLYGGGENIVAGTPNGISAMAVWMNSLGHRQNILSSYDRAGVGVAINPNSPYTYYSTQNFVFGK